MPKRPTRDLTIGVVAALALAILAAAILAVGGESRLFGNRAAYRVVFPNTVGLVVGSPVLIAGVQVGTVTDIQLPTDPSEPGIRVRLGIERRYTERVRQDSQASLRISQYLSGEKYVEITPGTAGEPSLPAGSLIPTMEETALFEQGKDIAENLNDITVSLRQILGPLERGEGLLGQMIQDPEFGKEGLERLKGTVTNLEVLTGRLREGEGFVGRALYDEEFATRIDDLSRGLESLSSLAQCLGGEGEASLCELLSREGDLAQAITDLRESVASMKKVADGLNDPEGLVGRLLHDEEYATRLADNLDTTLGELSTIVEKINQGEGTLGALVNERVLYDGAEDVVAGVNDSKFARWLLRHYRKKGIKAQERDDEGKK